MWLSLPNAFPEKDPAQVKLNSKIENWKSKKTISIQIWEDIFCFFFTYFFGGGVGPNWN